MAPPHIALDRIMSACYEFKKQISASLYLNNLMIILLIVFTRYMRLVLMVYPMLFSSIRIVIPLQSTALKVGVVLCKHRIRKKHLAYPNFVSPHLLFWCVDSWMATGLNHANANWIQANSSFVYSCLWIPSSLPPMLTFSDLSMLIFWSRPSFWRKRNLFWVLSS